MSIKQLLTPLAALALTLSVQAGAEPFSLPELPYATDALEPAINQETMQLHHGKHHQGYVNNLNAAVADDARLEGMPLERMLGNMSQYSEAARNNGGGHWNHRFFWEIMAPTGEGGQPSEPLSQAINDAFGSMQAFQERFQNAGASQFGSGWVWLIVAEDGELVVTSTPNQDNPLMDLAEERGTPILGNDVWEHAYYLTHKNARGSYLSAWWDVVNWEAVSANYRAAVAP